MLSKININKTISNKTMKKNYNHKCCVPCCHNHQENACGIHILRKNICIIFFHNFSKNQGRILFFFLSFQKTKKLMIYGNFVNAKQRALLH